MSPIGERFKVGAEARVASLFSGCGGLDLGFAQLGHDIVLALDHDPSAIKAYRANLRHDAMLLDVSDSAFEPTLRSLGSCDILLGGFPCQGFSKAGPKRQTDERNLLYRAMIHALHVLKPLVFIAENVDGLAQNYNGTFLKRILEDCSKVGYRVEWRLVDALWFGAPQHRRRIIIVGIRDDIEVPFQWPTATHRPIARNGERAAHRDYPEWAETLNPPPSMGDAFVGLHDGIPDHNPAPVDTRTAKILRRIPTGRKLCNARHDATSVRTWDIPEVFGEVSAREISLLETIARNRRHRRYGDIPNGNPLPLQVLRELFSEDLQESELDNLVDRGYLKKVGPKWDLRGAMFASGLYKRPLLQEPSPTVLTVFGNPRYFAHPIEDRPFTVREAARLQTFPDDYVFRAAGVADEDAYRLIGNAVPPLLAGRLAVAATDVVRAHVGVTYETLGGEPIDVAATGAVVA